MREREPQLNAHLTRKLRLKLLTNVQNLMMHQGKDIVSIIIKLNQLQCRNIFQIRVYILQM
ncbi:hypothetical protein CUM25_19345 [Escherichia coli]|nr:hypothetical protein [Escherichia coli]